MALKPIYMLTYTRFSKISQQLCRYLIILAAMSAPISTMVCSIACVGIIVTWLLSGQVISGLKIAYQHPVGKAILIFVGWLLISMFYADTSAQTKLTTLLSWQKLFFVFILLGFFYQADWQRRFVYSYFIFMSLAALISLLCWFVKFGTFDQSPGIIMTNYVAQSIALIAALLCAVFLLNKPDSGVPKAYLWLSNALFVINIFIISPARSGYIALPPALIFAGIYFYGFKKLPQLIAILFSIIMIAGLSSSNLQQRIKLGLQEQTSYQTSASETSIGLRMIFYKNTMELISQNPLWGYGTSSFESVYSHYAAAQSSDWHGGKTGDPHNQYLFIWLENGLVGLILFGFYIYYALRVGWYHPAYGQIAAGFLIAICASSLFNSHFKTFPEGNLLAFFMGALLALPPKSTKAGLD
ncbi:O-antigen ligase family protein [Methylomonas paludis]|nr:O-antigen ligase family protein [Methylomonas paludis]